ncbi:GIY-YIG nuclease family protein [Vibrio nomapromontoriensis]|uniref:GIY-YIG nuclease family protein n=1 Tax=Vibrio nomapromontoriensis TaxID=2910246 RepID=UPI003D10385A
MTKIAEPWTVYLLRTNEQKLYCGITNNMTRRLKQHESGKGAKALRGRGPLSLVWTQSAADKSDALKIEFAIKKLSKAQKEQLVANSKRFILGE